MHYADEATVRAVLEDHRTAPVPARTRVMLAFLEKLTLDPASVTAEDLTPLRGEGLSDRAIAEAVYVCAMFSMMVRLADTFDFALPSEKDRAASVRMLTRFGYRMASIPG